MCHHFTYLAKADGQHYIAYCKHGSLHLTWGRATLHLQPGELGDMVCFLAEAQTRATSERYLSDGTHYALEVHSNHLQVWLLGVGFHLSRSDLDGLLSLLTEAERRLQTSHGRSDAMAKVARSVRFSLN